MANALVLIHAHNYWYTDFHPASLLGQSYLSVSMAVLFSCKTFYYSLQSLHVFVLKHFQHYASKDGNMDLVHCVNVLARVSLEV